MVEGVGGWEGRREGGGGGDNGQTAWGSPGQPLKQIFQLSIWRGQYNGKD